MQTFERRKRWVFIVLIAKGTMSWTIGATCPRLLLPCGTGPIAQLVEQRTLNPEVEGSIPSGLTDSNASTSRAAARLPFLFVVEPNNAILAE